jgi:4-hydroxy-tetrahydrodipicolinate synthase
MPVFDFRGAWTALVTPFKSDGSVDYGGLEKNIEFQIDQGITGILPVGTTGESPTLTEKEHPSIIKQAKKFAGKRCDVLAGTGSNSTREALGYCGHALHAGIDKVLLVDCYYNGPSTLELREEYYSAILEAHRDIKIVVYVIPGRTGTAISPADIAILAGRYDRLIAVKEATGDIARMEEERALMPAMSIMSGDDDKTFEMMASPKIKSQGVISVTSNIAPKAVQELVSALLSGNTEKGKSFAQKLKPLFSTVTVKVQSKRTLPGGKEVTVEDRFRNPVAIKAMMNVLGMPAGPGRRPLGKLTRDAALKLKEALSAVHRDAPEVLEPLAAFYKVDLPKRIADDSLWDGLVY